MSGTKDKVSDLTLACMHNFNAVLPMVAGGVKPGAWGAEVSRLIEQYDHMRVLDLR